MAHLAQLLCAGKDGCYLIDRKEHFTWVSMVIPRGEIATDRDACGGWPPAKGKNFPEGGPHWILDNTLLDGELGLKARLSYREYRRKLQEGPGRSDGGA